MAGPAVPLAQASTAYRQGVLLVLLATCFFSLSGVLVRLTDGAGSWQIIFYRSVALTGTMLVLLAIHYRQRMMTAVWSAGWDGLLAGAASSGALVLFILSLETITVANALFMSGIAPFVTALLGRAFLKEPIPLITWIAMILGMAGVAVMVEGALSFDRLLGNLLALAGAISYALMSFFLRRGRQGDMLPASLASGMISSALALAVLLFGARDIGGSFAISAHDLALCVTMGVVQLGLGMVCYTRGAQHVPAAQLQLVAMAELALSPLWVWLVVAEVPPPAALLGGMLILLATLIQAVAGGWSRRWASTA